MATQYTEPMEMENSINHNKICVKRNHGGKIAKKEESTWLPLTNNKTKIRIGKKIKQPKRNTNKFMGELNQKYKMQGKWNTT